MNWDMLNNVSINYVQNMHVIKATIDHEAIVVSHFASIIVRKNVDGSVTDIAHLDPWQNTIEFRHRTDDKQTKYRLTALLTDGNCLDLTDWLVL